MQKIGKRNIIKKSKICKMQIFFEKVAKKSLTYGENMILLQLFFEKSGRLFKASLGRNRGVFQRTGNE